MKTVLAKSTDYLATLSTVFLAAGVGFMTVCLFDLSTGYPAQAKTSWDTGLTSLIAGLALGAGACKCSQLRRKLNQ
jgi:hypothetical protein